MKPFEILFDETLKDIKTKKEGNWICGTGFSKLDEITGGGLHRGSTTILGGRPGTGKTTFVNQVVFHIAKTNPDAVVLYFSLEMMPVLQMKKFMSLALGMTLKQIEESEESYLNEAFEEFKKCKILLHGDPVSIYKMEYMVEDRVKKWERSKASYFPVVVVDHSRLVTKINQKSEKERLDELSYRMMEIKKKYGAINLIVSQLNRTSEHEGPKSPGQADVYGSDALVQDADLVILLSKLKPETTFKNVMIESDRYVGAYTVKNRFGPEDKFLLYSNLEINQFTEVK